LRFNHAAIAKKFHEFYCQCGGNAVLNNHAGTSRWKLLCVGRPVLTGRSIAAWGLAAPTFAFHFRRPRRTDKSWACSAGPKLFWLTLTGHCLLVHLGMTGRFTVLEKMLEATWANSILNGVPMAGPAPRPCGLDSDVACGLSTPSPALRRMDLTSSQ
jgi:hypothetical protein